MDIKAVDVIKNGFRRFDSNIHFTTSGNIQDVIEKAISQDPKIIYYLHSYSASGSYGNYVLKALYIHKDTERTDIQIVRSQSECVELMCQYVGKYRKKLIVIAKGNMDLSKSIKLFHESYASFYPNLTLTKGLNYHQNAEYSVFEFTFEYRLGWVKLAQMDQDVDNEVKRIGKILFVPGLSSEAKIYLAHNYLATNVVYINEKDNKLDVSYTQSAYGALINKHCVCQGYAEAFKRLMDYAGIECQVIYGKNIGSTTLHAWNIVSLGNGSSYYHIDVTWDSSSFRPDYTYFCKNDAFFKGKREWNREFNPTCSGSYPVLAIARKNIMMNKTRLISSGVDKKVIDC